MLFVNEICIGLLQQCNWKCDYCIVYNNSKKLDEDAIFDELYPIRHKLKYLWISGGEPGILSENFWSRLLDSIDFNIMICTNGTFIVDGLYDKFKHRVASMSIHCVSELTDEIHPKVLDVIRQEIPNVTINIVIHKRNVSHVRDFLTKYNDILFHINYADTSFFRSYMPKYHYAIDREAALVLFKQFGSLPKYQSHLNNITRALINNNFEYLNFWSPKNVESARIK